MTPDTWADPVDVLVHVAKDQAAQRFTWALVWSPTLQRRDAQAVAGSADSWTDAHIAAMAAMAEHCSALPVNLYCEQARFIDAVRSLPSWAHVEAHDPRKARAHRLRAPALEAAHHHERKPDPVVVAVDGSFSVSRRTGGWAWIDQNGNFGQGHGRVSSAVHAELMGIKQALKQVPKQVPKQAAGRHVLIRCDCLQALTLVREGISSSTPLKLRPCVRQIRDHRSFGDATFEWVRGHAGDPLNEAANRLALAARRDADADTPAHVAKRVADMIANEHLEALRHGALVEATPKVGVYN